jgi:glycosyltransferase involved in cell wall biosynthesis
VPYETASIIIPCYNEQATIRLLLDAIYKQTYPRTAIEVIIVDGMSTDRTREEIAAFQGEHTDLAIRLIDNPARIIPAGLNLGICAASGQILIRLDGHAVPVLEYVERCVRDLDAGLGDNVGGVWEIHPARTGAIAAGIAAAASHPLGVGDARYRYTARSQSVDTVPFFAFRRSLLDRTGKYDENLLTNEDYEFNVRVRQSGGTVWLDPAIRSTYYARPTLSALARQYWRYGFWKGRMLLHYPRTLRWRQALPPVFTASLIGLVILAVAVPWARWMLAGEIAIYCLVLLGAGALLALKQRDIAMLISLPLAIATMHLSWGTALWWSLIKFILKKK